MNQGTWDGGHFLEALRAASRALDAHIASLNALNVFPVPDGDTGTNMASTLSSALRDVTPDPSCGVVAERVGYWATMRGRGNSGIILSQILRGIAAALDGHHLMSGRELASALAQGSTRAYEAVLRPVEGTMLTVVRYAAEAAQHSIVSGEASLGAVLHAAVQNARAAVKQSPQLLATLRDAGVVDAGGQGILIMLEALLRYARGEVAEISAPPTDVALLNDDHSDGVGFCTSFVLHHASESPAILRQIFAQLGESLVVAGDQSLVKIHLHTLRPGDALNRALEYGILDQIEVANMDLQSAARREQATARQQPTLAAAARGATDKARSSIGVIAMALGSGFAAILRDLRADLVWETSAAPSVDEWIAAFEQLPQHELIVLPNDRQAAASARQAAARSSKRVEVLPAIAAPQGIAALLALNFQAGLEHNVQVMSEALRRVRVAALERLHAGAPAAPATATPNIADELRRLGAERAEIASFYYGQEVDLARVETLVEQVRAAFPDLEIEIHAGGQPESELIIALE